MTLINRIFTRNATLFGYLAVAVPLTVEYWAPWLISKGGRWAIAGTLATLAVNALRASLEDKS